MTQVSMNARSACLGALTLLGAVVVLPPHAPATAIPDVTQVVNIEYKIAKSRDGYRLDSKYVEKRTYGEAVAKPEWWDVGIIVHEYPFIKLESARVRYNGKTLDKRRQQIRNWVGGDVFVSDNVLHVFNVSESFEAGDEVDIEYRQRFAGLEFLPVIQVPNDRYLQSYRVRFVHPKSVEVTFEPFFSRDSIPYTVRRDKPGLTELTMTNIAPRERLAYFPYNDSHAAFLVSVSDANRVVDVSTSQAFLAWYQGQLTDSLSVSDETLARLAESVSPEADDLHKLQAIHDFVRARVRYLADTRESFAYLPHDPVYTLERGYGDCKDRAYAVQALARAYGIRVDLALVATDPRPRFAGTNIQSFDHMLCAYAGDDGIHYFDPTCRYCEFEELPSADVGAPVLRLAESADWPAAIPISRRRPTLELWISGSVDSTTAVATVALRYDYAIAMREARTRLTGADMENFASAMINDTFYSLSLGGFEWLQDAGGAVRLEARVDLSKFRVETEKRIYFPRTPFLVAATDILDRDKDADLVRLESPGSIALHLDLALEGCTADLDSLSLGAPAVASFVAKATTFDPDRLHLDFEWNRPEIVYESSHKQRLLELFRRYLQSRAAMFTLSKEQS